MQPELFLVGSLDGKILATLMAGYEGHRGWVNYLAVAPEYRPFLVMASADGAARLDTLENLISQPSLGLLFMIPGADETLRINGKASLRTDDALIDLCAPGTKRTCS